MAAETTSAQDAGPQFSDAERALLDVCDRLGWARPGVTGPVAFERGPDPYENYLMPEDGEAVRFPGWGWIVAETGGSVTLLDSHAIVRTVRRTTAAPKESEAVVEPLDPAAAVERVLHPPETKWDDPMDGAYRSDAWCSRVIAAAQMRAAGRGDLARRLLDALEPWNETPPVTVARDQMAIRVLWRVMRDFEEPAVPRTDLLRRMRVWDGAFRGTEYEPRAKDLLRELERMVPEDDAHARRERPAGEPAIPERAAELIYLLRDCDNAAQRRTGSSPKDWRFVGRELAGLGWEAVPVIVEALADTRPVRAISCWRFFDFSSHRVIRVGDLAADVLRSATGREFVPRGERIGCGDARWAEVVAAASAWWKEWGPKGEVASLRERLTALDGWGRTEVFRRLAKIDPAQAIDLALAELSAATSEHERVAAIADLALVEGPRATDLLRERLAKEESLDARIVAAMALHRRDAPEMRRFLLDLWAAAATRSGVPDSPATRTLAAALMRLDDEGRAAVVATARAGGAVTYEDLAALWREMIDGTWKAQPALDRTARDFTADLALERLRDPPLAAIAWEHAPGPSGDHPWDTKRAAIVLDRMRGGGHFDPSSSPLRRWLAIDALVAAECEDRKLPRPPAPAPVLTMNPAPDAAFTGIASLALAAGNELAPGEGALTPLRALVGTTPDAEALEAAMVAAFRARPDGCLGLALRLRRGTGPMRAEAYFVTGHGGTGVTVRLGTGDGVRRSIGRNGGTPESALDLDPSVRESIADLLRRAAGGDWILDVALVAR